jgi:hypothetical protein
MEAYMKRIFSFSIMNLMIIALALSVLCSCENFDTGGGDKIDGTRMSAEILAIGEKIEVQVIEGDYEVSGIYWVIISPDTKYFGADGKGASLADFTVGDKIEIVYGGQVMMSYPPQIVAKKITKIP